MRASNESLQVGKKLYYFKSLLVGRYVYYWKNGVVAVPAPSRHDFLNYVA